MIDDYYSPDTESWLPGGAGDLDYLHSYAQRPSPAGGRATKLPSLGYGDGDGTQEAFVPWNGENYEQWHRARNASQLVYQQFTDVDADGPGMADRPYDNAGYDTRTPVMGAFSRITQRQTAQVYRLTRPFNQQFEQTMTGEHFSMNRQTRRDNVRQRPIGRFSTLDHTALPPNSDLLEYQGSGGGGGYLEDAGQYGVGTGAF